MVEQGAVRSGSSFMREEGNKIGEEGDWGQSVLVHSCSPYPSCSRVSAATTFPRQLCQQPWQACQGGLSAFDMN